MTEAQEAILNDLRTFAKRYRHMGRTGGWVLPEYTDHFDRRSFNALLKRGLIVISEYGYKAA